MKKLFLLLMTVLSVSLCASAQMRTVTGTVVEEANDEPVIGASVTPAGSTKGVVTDIDGNFELQVPAGVKAITVSYVGFTTQTVAITGSHLHIALKNSAEVLNDVIVVAYGVSKKSEYTGSAGVIKSDELEDALVSNVTNAVSGKIAGVQTFSSNGQPGTSASIRVRGTGSINAGSTPLYVVDGLPFDGDISTISPTDIESMTVIKDAASTALYGARGANGVILVTTKRGKEGNAKITVDMRWGANTRAVPQYKVITDARQYIETVYNAYANSAETEHGYEGLDKHNYALSNIWSSLGYQTWSVPAGQTIIGTNGKFNPNATPGYVDGNYYYIADDWTKGTLSTGLRQEYNLNITGGTERLSYYISGNYLEDEGLITNSHFNRLSTRAVIDYQAKKWLKIGANLSYTYTNSGYPDDQTSSGSTGNAFELVNSLAPVYPMYIRDAQGNILYNTTYNRPIFDYGDGADYGLGRTGYTRNTLSSSNPAGDLLYNTEDYLADVFDGKWYATLTPISGLTVTGTAGYHVDNTREHYLANNLYGQSANYGGTAAQAAYRYRTINLQALATYARQFGDHNLSLMLGFENQSYQVETVSASGQSLYNPGSFVVSNTIDEKTGSGSQANLVHRGLLANFKYNYLGRYYFTLAGRRDGSSRFAPEHRWGNFWSVSGGWDISKESFMAETKSYLDMLKFKISFGQNGNDNIGYNYNAYADQYHITGADGVWADGELTYKGNRDITWETSNSFNTGFDFSFWHGKLSGSLEYYQRQTSDMLFYLPVAPSLGYSSYPANVGSMRNNGFELELNYTILDNRDITWDVNANLTMAGNKVLHLDPSIVNTNTSWQEDSQMGWLSGSSMYVEGKSMYNLWMVEYAGVNPENGNALYYTWGNKLDENGDKIPYSYEDDGVTVKEYVKERQTTESYSEAYNNGRIETGNLAPKGYGGFGTSISSHGIDFSAQFAYQFGGRLYDSAYAGYMYGGYYSSLGTNMHQDLLNAWTPTNTNTDVPRLDAEGDTGYYAGSTSTRFLVSSNYLSLNNITLGYTFPQKWVRKAYLDNVRIYFAAENVALWSARKGLDPRQSYTSSSNSTYSPIRSISGGVKVTF
jgi:TonB-linked SusC/RagA family outer membrane protein